MSAQRNASDALRALMAAQRDLQPIANSRAQVAAAMAKMRGAEERLRRALPGIKD